MGDPVGAKMGMNGSPVAPHRLILSQDGAIPSRMLFISAPCLFDLIFGSILAKMGVRTSGVENSRISGVENPYILHGKAQRRPPALQRGGDGAERRGGMLQRIGPARDGLEDQGLIVPKPKTAKTKRLYKASINDL